jgi:hypothetical protein
VFLPPSKSAFPIAEKIIVVMLMLFCAGVVFYQTSRAAPLWDLSYTIENAYRISLGDIPYKDFGITIAPGTFLVQALIIKIFGVSLIHYFEYCAVISALTFLLTYVLLGFLQNDRKLNLALALPVAISGGYGIYSYPSYDVDCTFWMLVALTALLWSRAKDYPPLATFLSGILAFLPTLFKQNTGPVFLLFVHLTFFLSAFLRKNKLELKRYTWFLIGTLTAMIGTCFMVYFTSGFSDAFFWMFAYPSQNRIPNINQFISPYIEKSTVIGVTLWAEAYLLARYSLGKKNFTTLLVVLLFITPFLLVPALEYAWFNKSFFTQALEIWPITLLITGFAGLLGIFNHPKEQTFEKLLALLLVAVSNASFLAQGLFGSTYGIEPFLSILLCLLFLFIKQKFVKIDSSPALKREDNPGLLILRRIFFLQGIILATIMAFYVESNLRLHFYLNLNGPLQKATTPQLAGLNTPGPWIPELEQLLDYARKEIPSEDPVLLLQLEDPFYFALQRHDLFPIKISDVTDVPYSCEELENMMEKYHVKWIVEKIRLQLSAGTPRFAYRGCIPITNFIPYKRLNDYFIYKRVK